MATFLDRLALGARIEQAEQLLADLALERLARDVRAIYPDAATVHVSCGDPGEGNAVSEVYDIEGETVLGAEDNVPDWAITADLGRVLRGGCGRLALLQPWDRCCDYVVALGPITSDAAAHAALQGTTSNPNSSKGA